MFSLSGHWDNISINMKSEGKTSPEIKLNKNQQHIEPTVNKNKLSQNRLTAVTEYNLILTNFKIRA